jgi:uncharacterized membrane protein (DUF2068 family)
VVVVVLVLAVLVVLVLVAGAAVEALVVVGAAAVLVVEVVPDPPEDPHAARARAASTAATTAERRIQRGFEATGCGSCSRYGSPVTPPSEGSEHRPPGTDHPRKRRKIDWELVVCGWKGHCLVGTDAREVRPEDHMIVRQYATVRWYRCLRCDTWVGLEPPTGPGRDHPPGRDEIEVPSRGKALRDKVVLRLIAIDRAIHFLVLGLLGVAVLLFANHETSLRDAYYRILTDLQGGVAGSPVQNTGHVGILHDLDKLFTLRRGTLREVGAALLAYGVLEGTEAVGLWLTKRWAEYLTFLATTILLPFEIYELSHRASPLKIIGFIINVAVVVYLLYAKRLFGLRGGGKVDEQLRAYDMSWEAIERATPPNDEIPARAPSAV